ncbi:hypothetical protein K9M47_00160 [Candidatus Gracilibacteria bacterium]|nr:hypothetical protein [Candidatus Gracilibacteria bacterium]MCF7898390.1 hypothetical protein [Candidatus Paceibacterota bacterium]
MKKLSFLKISIILTVILSPVYVFSATGAREGAETFASLVSLFTNSVMSAVGGLLVSGGMLAFLYGVVEYIWARRNGDSKGLEDGNRFMAWGLIGLFIMFSVYGIIKLGQGILFGNKDVTTISIPNIKLK